MGRKKYKNDPIVEAICEFRLSQDTPWDLTIPGLFYEKVKDNFPERDQRLVQEIELTQEPQDLQHRVRVTERVLLYTRGRKRLIQLGPRLLVINVLRPYPSWEQFKSYIETAWSCLKELVSIRGLQRIGLRYINRIEFSDKNVDLKEYFEFYPYVGDRLPKQMSSFIAGVDFPYAEGRDRCRVKLTPSIASENRAAVVLDIDYFLNNPADIPASDVLEWVEEAHSRVDEIFEGCITDRLRKQFGEES